MEPYLYFGNQEVNTGPACMIVSDEESRIFSSFGMPLACLEFG